MSLSMCERQGTAWLAEQHIEQAPVKALLLACVLALLSSQ
jgi:hypothetical protein